MLSTNYIYALEAAEKGRIWFNIGLGYIEDDNVHVFKKLNFKQTVDKRIDITYTIQRSNPSHIPFKPSLFLRNYRKRKKA